MGNRKSVALMCSVTWNKDIEISQSANYQRTCLRRIFPKVIQEDAPTQLFDHSLYIKILSV